MSGKASKAKGAAGERIVRRTLDRDGWLIPHKQTTGLAGDDLFARDPDGTWWSIEVKHTKHLMLDFLKQAKAQALARAKQVRTAKPNHPSKVLGIEYDHRNWMLVWVPSGWGNGKQAIVFQGQAGGGCQIGFWHDRVNGKVEE